MCQTPRRILNPMLPSRRKLENAPLWIDVPCGKCSHCLKRRMLDWTFRLKQENLRSTNCYFTTLTYADHAIPQTETHYTLHKADLQKFFKRLRKRQARLSEEKIKYYAVGEYGGLTQRPHYHALLFNLADPKLVQDAWSYYGDPIGFTDCEPLKHDGGIGYVVNYFIGNHDTDLRAKEFSCMSKNLGDNYLTPEMIDYHKRDLRRCFVTNPGGIKQPMPRYYKNKIYTEEEQKWISGYLDIRTNEILTDQINAMIKKGHASESYIDHNGRFVPSAEIIRNLRSINAKHIINTKKMKV